MFAEHMKRGNPWEENPFGSHHYPLHHHHHSPHSTMSSSTAGTTGTCSSEAAAPHMIPIRIMEDNYSDNNHHHNNHNHRNNSPLSMQLPMQIPMQMDMEMPDMDIPLEFKQPISKIEIPNCFLQVDDQNPNPNQNPVVGRSGGQRVMNIPPPLNMSNNNICNELPQQQQPSSQTLNQHIPFMDQQQQQQQNRIPSPINSPSHTSGGGGGIRHIPIFLEGQAPKQGGPPVVNHNHNHNLHNQPTSQSQNQNQNQNLANNNNNSNTSNISHNNNNHTTNSSNANNNHSTENCNSNSPKNKQQQPIPIAIPLPPPITIIDELKQGRTPPSPPPRSPKNMKPNYNSNNNNISTPINSSDDLKSHRTTFPFASNTNNLPSSSPTSVPSATAAASNTRSSSPNSNSTNNNDLPGNVNNVNLKAMDDSQINVPPPQKKPTPSTPIEKIQAISEDVKELEKQVSEFTGVTKTKEYIFLDEMLTRNLIKLDDIEVGGKEDVRMARKECIKLVNNCINNLEAKVISNNSNNNNNSDKIATAVVAVQKIPQQSQSPPYRDQLGLGRGHQHHRSELNFLVNNGEEKKSQNFGDKIAVFEGEGKK